MLKNDIMLKILLKREKMKKIILSWFLAIAYLNANVMSVTDKTYEELIKKDAEVVVMFAATWCGACKQMKPVYKKLDESWNEKITFAQVDVDENKLLSNKFKIKALPTIVVFKDGKEIKREVGSLGKFELMQLLRPKSAFKLYTKECDANNLKACVELGEAYEEGEKVKKDYLKSLHFYEKACQGKNAKGCAYLAYLYDNEMGVKLDNQKVVEYYKKGCDGDYAWSCQKLADIYTFGYNKEKVDGNRALTLYQKACKQNNKSSCASVAWYYLGTKEIKAEYKKAKFFAQKACDANDAVGCRLLGYIYDMGLGVKKDVQKAIELYSYACNKKDKTACENLKILQKK